MKTKIVVYGGTNLSHDLIFFVSSLVSELLQYPEVVIMSGGFDHYINHPERKSVDRVVFDTANKILSTKDFNERFETWLPEQNDRKKVVRFEAGKVKRIAGTTQARRFNIVQHADAIITIRGEGNTRSVIELALAINKPVLPLPFTEGDSKKMWEMYKDDITRLITIPNDLIEVLEGDLEPQTIPKLSKNLAGLITAIATKKCLVLMPFGADHDNFYDNFLSSAIDEAGYKNHRIDRNDPAGNIPQLFRTNLENARAVIADITNLNPNVLFELGYANAHNISLLIICRKKEGVPEEKVDIPFYLKQEMIVIANDNNEGYKKLQDTVKGYLISRISSNKINSKQATNA